MAKIIIGKERIVFNRQSFPNRLRYNQLVYSIKKSNYDVWYASIGGDEARNDEVENGPFAPFNEVFYELFAKSQVIPTPKKVCEEYAKRYCIDLGEGKCSLANGFIFSRNALYGRITRAYCSWCRELTLLYALFETLPKGFEAYYDLAMDKHGVDIVIFHNKKQYNIHSYLNSAKSVKYRKEKDFRYTTETGVHLDVIATQYNTQRVGVINIHGLANAADLLRMMYEHENSVG